MSANHTILEMRSITKEFPGVKALSEVSISVRAGAIHAICGENGAGKSTLMNVLSGVHPAGTYTGDIIFQGEPVHFKDIGSSEAAGIVIIHQELALIPELSITENISLATSRPNTVRSTGSAPRSARSSFWPGSGSKMTPIPRSSTLAWASNSSSRSPKPSASR
jgi:ABC-type sugar transport system ATPase subunit